MDSESIVASGSSSTMDSTMFLKIINNVDCNYWDLKDSLRDMATYYERGWRNIHAAL